MSSGKTNVISCGEFGTIEHIHTRQRPKLLMHQLTYDHKYGLWGADAYLVVEVCRNFTDIETQFIVVPSSAPLNHEK